VKRTIRALVVALGFGTALALAQTSAPSGGPQSASIFDIAKEQVERQQSQPLNNAPVWREVNSGKAHTTNIKGPEAGVLIQREGEAWRQLRPSIYSTGGVLFAVVLALLAAFYLVKGPIRTSVPFTGKTIERFTPVDRITHWTMAISFVVLGLTGLIMTFGKFVLLPVVGYTLFGWLASVAKNTHNFIAPVFLVSIPIAILVYIRDNLPNAQDIKWAMSLGGLLNRGEPMPAGRFSGSQKLYFYGLVCFLSIISILSGLVMLFPNFEFTRAQMQLANTVHLITAMLSIAMALPHIYLGTVGNVGAYEGMRQGRVDETWAREHHPLWYDDVVAGRVRGASGSGAAPTAPAQVAGVSGNAD
jgi:formate dehydrogenase subunit gamma